MFGYLCKECGKPLDTRIGNLAECRMQLLSKGEVIEEQSGEYDAYGRCDGIEWETDWGQCIDMQFSDDDSEGFAVVHKQCDKGKNYSTMSKNDPSQAGLFRWYQKKDGTIKIR